MPTNKTAWTLCAIGAAFSLSCGGSKSKLDCAWLASNNCWKSTTAAASNCLPGDSAVGTLSADNRTCTFGSSNIVISFDDPLVLPVSDSKQWKFTVTSAGQQCLRYEDTAQNSSKVTTSSGTVAQASAGFTLDVTCPNGSVYESSNAFELLNCSSDAGLSSFPGGKYWSSSGTTSITFGIFGTPSGSMQIFSCQKN